MESLIIIGLLVHFLADFVCQRDEDAKLKSVSWEHLTNHTMTYSLIWAFAMTLILALSGLPTIMVAVFSLFFGALTFIAHTLTDYFTSRWVKKLFDKHDYHNGFVVIGLDQILHYLQLFYTYKLITTI